MKIKIKWYNKGYKIKEKRMKKIKIINQKSVWNNFFLVLDSRSDDYAYVYINAPFHDKIIEEFHIKKLGTPHGIVVKDEVYVPVFFDGEHNPGIPCDSEETAWLVIAELKQRM
jgi:hypothetical protein